MGKLIVFEGTDGAGKTTLISLTKKYLEEKNGIGKRPVRETAYRFVEKTNSFKSDVLLQARGYQLSRRTAFNDVGQDAARLRGDRTALKAGKTVICDRYIYTSLANMLARGYRDEKWFYEAAKHLLKPDLAFLAYANPLMAIERIKSRPDECDRHLDEPLLLRVAGEFLGMAKGEGFVVLDTEGEPEKAFAVVERELLREESK